MRGMQIAPARVDGLHGMDVVALAAGKFHSAALARNGTLFTWGFGRGGRLGHPEFDIHSGESAVIAPRPVGGLAKRAVAALAAAKHHMAAALATGELFTWGCNRDGRLGYPAPDTQATPRRCAPPRAAAA